jgi:hypothetical protein
VYGGGYGQGLYNSQIGYPETNVDRVLIKETRIQGVQEI